MLIFIEGVLSKDEVKQFCEYFDQVEWQDGLKMVGMLVCFVKCNL